MAIPKGKTVDGVVHVQLKGCRSPLPEHADGAPPLVGRTPGPESVAVEVAHEDARRWRWE